MNIHKDKEFEVLLTVLAENLAYNRVLSGLLLSQIYKEDKQLFEPAFEEINRRVKLAKADVLNALLSEHGDIDDLMES